MTTRFYLPNNLNDIPAEYLLRAKDRFEEKVDRSGNCHLWTSAVCGEYGVFTFLGEQWQAHRIAYLFGNGTIKLGLRVCHSCDTQLCVRFEHLFQGTDSDNMQDMLAKGRGNHKNVRKKIGFEEAEDIREIYASGYGSMAKVGVLFNVTASEVCLIVNNKLWVV